MRINFVGCHRNCTVVYFTGKHLVLGQIIYPIQYFLGKCVRSHIFLADRFSCDRGTNAGTDENHQLQMATLATHDLAQATNNS